MALPRQIEAALAAADATLAQANGSNPAPPEEARLTQDDQFQQPVEQSAPQPEAAPVVPPPQVEKPDVWAHKYDVLRGKYDAEVPRLHQQVRELETSLRTAVERLDTASKAKESTPEQRQAVDPKDVENFGEDLVQMVDRVAGQAIARASQVFDAKVAQFEAKITELQATMKGTSQQVAMTAEQSFFERVSKLVPEWEAINVDPGFLAWLNEVDPVYGVARQAALSRAQESLNADHAAAVFRAYLGPQKSEPKKPDPLDKQVSPRGAATVQPTPTEKPVFTSAQITEFYDNVRRGMYRGNEAEAARIEQVINTALSEGRVR